MLIGPDLRAHFRMCREGVAPDAKGHGTEKVIEAVHKRAGKINPLVVPAKLAATVITIALGGSAVKEGHAPR